MDSIRLMTLLSGSIQSSLSKSTKDIPQVMILLDQTIDQLIQHFLSINRDIQELKKQLPEKSASTALDRTEQAVQSIVTNLQFHDIANQLLNRVQVRSSSLQHMLSAIAADSALMTTSSNEINFTDLKAYLECIERLIADTHSQSQSPHAETIRQAPMSGGEIELF